MNGVPRSFVGREREGDDDEQRVKGGPAENFLVPGKRDDEAGSGEEGEGELLPEQSAFAVPAEETQIIPPRLFVSAGASGRATGGVGVGGDGVAEAGKVSAKRGIEESGDEQSGGQSEDEVASEAGRGRARAGHGEQGEEGGKREERRARFGRLHEARARASGDDPCRASRAPPTLGADERGEEKGDEEGFLDEVAAVVDRSGSDCHECGGGEGGPVTEGRGEGEEQQDAECPGECGHEADGGFVERGDGRLATCPSDRQCGVVKSGAVMVAGVEGVATVFEEVTDFDGLIGLVGMHRAPREVMGPEPERDQRDQREGQETKQMRGCGSQGGCRQHENISGAKRRIGLIRR